MSIHNYWRTLKSLKKNDQDDTLNLSANNKTANPFDKFDKENDNSKSQMDKGSKNDNSIQQDSQN